MSEKPKGIEAVIRQLRGLPPKTIKRTFEEFFNEVFPEYESIESIPTTIPITHTGTPKGGLTSPFMGTTPMSTLFRRSWGRASALKRAPVRYRVVSSDGDDLTDAMLYAHEARKHAKKG